MKGEEIMEEKDYQYLKELDFIVISNGIEIPGKVAEVEFDIGITIVNKNDHTQYLSCLRSPLIVAHEIKNTNKSSISEKEYKEFFNYLVRCITRGKLSLVDSNNKLKNISGRSGGNSPSIDTCAFS